MAYLLLSLSLSLSDARASFRFALLRLLVIKAGVVVVAVVYTRWKLLAKATVSSLFTCLTSLPRRRRYRAFSCSALCSLFLPSPVVYIYRTRTSIIALLLHFFLALLHDRDTPLSHLPHDLTRIRNWPSSILRTQLPIFSFKTPILALFFSFACVTKPLEPL